MADDNFLSNIVEEKNYFCVLWNLEIGNDFNNTSVLSSPYFPLNNDKPQWKIDLHFNNETPTTENYHSVLVCRRQSKHTMMVNCVLNILDSGYNLGLKICSLAVFDGSNDTFRVNQGLKSELQPYISSGAFKIQVVIEKLNLFNLPRRNQKDQGTYTENYNKRSLNGLKQNFSALLESQKFSDFTIIVDGQAIAAHKNILASRSSVFRAILDDDIRDIEIIDIDRDTMISLLRFIYANKVHLSNVIQAQKLFAAAGLYDVLDLKQVCEDYILENTEVADVIDVLIFSDYHNATKIKAHAIKYAIDNIYVLNGSQFDSLADSAPRMLAALLKGFIKKNLEDYRSRIQSDLNRINSINPN